MAKKIAAGTLGILAVTSLGFMKASAQRPEPILLPNWIWFFLLIFAIGGLSIILTIYHAAAQDNTQTSLPIDQEDDQ